MAEGTLIEWARHPVTKLGATWNIVTGCDIVSPGCTNCYAMKLAGSRLRNHPSRKGLTVQTKAGPVWNGEARFNEQWLTQPLTWKQPHGIFVAAHGDLFADGVTDDQLDHIFAVMVLCPQHIFYVLTKRPERMRAYFQGRRENFGRASEAMMSIDCSVDEDEMQEAADWLDLTDIGGRPLQNGWRGVSVEDQKRANERIPILLDTPAAIRFVSAEPLLGPVDLTYIDDGLKDDTHLTFNALTGLAHDGHQSISGIFGQPDPRIDWVIVGGESGPRAMHPDWAVSLRDQCAEADVAFFFKQWGTWLPVTCDEGQISYGRHDRHEFADGLHAYKVGKRAAGRRLLRRTHDEYPEIPA